MLLVAAGLIFFRLDQRLLWNDEAETALLGRNILRYGIPKAFDGRNLISQEVGLEFGANYVWRWTPWLEKYLAAAAFAVAGESTLTARLPFALIGWLAVLSEYFLALRLFGDRWTGVLAMAFLTFSVPFLLHVRQCRYYSPLILATIWAVYFLVGLGRGQRGSVIGFVLAMTVLFQSNILTCIATAVAFAPCTVILGFDRAAYRRTALAAGVLILLDGPWAYFYLIGKAGEQLYGFGENLRYLVGITARYTLPVAVVLLFVPLAWRMRSTHPLVADDARRPLLVLVVIPVVLLLTLATAPWSFYRYTLGLLPLSAVLLAFMCRAILGWNRLAGAALTGVLLFTGLFSQLSAWPTPAQAYSLQTEGRSFPAFDTFFPLGNFLYELTHPVDGPMEHLVAYLSANAKPTDRIFISYGDLVLMFYTDHEIRGGQSGRQLEDWPEPEWVIVRGFFRFGDRAVQRADAEHMLAWLNGEVAPDHYEQVPAPWSDFPWDDIPEPDLHWYRVPSGGGPMRIYHRTTAAP